MRMQLARRLVVSAIVAVAGGHTMACGEPGGSPFTPPPSGADTSAAGAGALRVVGALPPPNARAEAPTPIEFVTRGALDASMPTVSVSTLSGDRETVPLEAKSCQVGKRFVACGIVTVTMVTGRRISELAPEVARLGGTLEPVLDRVGVVRMAPRDLLRVRDALVAVPGVLAAELNDWIPLEGTPRPDVTPDTAIVATTARIVPSVGPARAGDGVLQVAARDTVVVTHAASGVSVRFPVAP